MEVTECSQTSLEGGPTGKTPVVATGHYLSTLQVTSDLVAPLLRALPTDITASFLSYNSKRLGDESIRR